MSSEDPRLAYAEITAIEAGQQGTCRVLAVGDCAKWRDLGHVPISDQEVHFADMDDVGETLLETLRPSLILSPVLSPRFDCIDLAIRLHAARFDGPYRALTSALPDPEMIEREIRALCPGLDFGVVLTG